MTPDPRAAAEQTAISVGHLLRDRYGLDGLRTIDVLPTTGRNVNAVLEDEHGIRYVARCCLRNRDPARIGFQLDLQEHLRAMGLPVPAVVATKNGDQTILVDGETWVTFEHIAGSGYESGSDPQLESAAGRLRDFHDAGRTFRGPTVADDTIPDLRRWWTHGGEELDKLREMFVGRGVDDELAFMSHWRAKLVGALPLSVVDELPTAWLHGDYHGENLAFRDGEVVGIFDFDVANHGWRLDDIARALYYFAGVSSGVRRLSQRRAETFVAGFGLSELERVALPAFVVAVHARTAARYRIRQREGGDPAKALRTHVARMANLEAERWG